MAIKLNPKKFELLTKWYLRFNGYFTIDNLIIHAADDLRRISNGVVGNYTDVDVLGIRMPFHAEMTGELKIKNDFNLQCVEKIDIVIGECKTGNQNGLNNVWSKNNLQAIEYLVRFCGVFSEREQITEVAKALLIHLKYEDERCRIRPILFGQETPSKEWQEKKLIFISCSNILDFLIVERGGCWVEEDIGVKSIHNPWDDLINDIFNVANDQAISREGKKARVYKILA
jgi:hypothetical protein